MRMKIAAIGYFIVLILILISFAVINLVRRSKRKKEQDMQYMRGRRHGGGDSLFGDYL